SFLFPPLRPPVSTLFPYTTLFRSPLSAGSTATATRASRPSRGRSARALAAGHFGRPANRRRHDRSYPRHRRGARNFDRAHFLARSEEHTSELQSRFDLVCRLLLEK